MVLVAGRARLMLLGRAEVVLGLSCQQGCPGLVHEIAEVGRDLRRSPVQPLPSRVTPSMLHRMASRWV